MSLLSNCLEEATFSERSLGKIIGSYGVFSDYILSGTDGFKIICQGTRFARTLTYTMMRISDTIGDPDSVL